MSIIGEPKHTQGHSTEITQTPNREFMCPECGKTFDIKDAAEKHLHSAHLKHLKAEHGEFHGQDVDTIHVG
jgi:competence CoiA-like predicted nuclease